MSRTSSHGSAHGSGNDPRERRNHALVSSLNDLLGRFGVERAGTIDDVLERCNAVLRGRGHVGTAVGIRHGEIRVESDGAAARLLSYDLDQILADIEQTHPGVVDRIIVTRRGRNRS